MPTVSSAINLINGDTDPAAPSGSLETLFYVKNGLLYSKDVAGTISSLLGASTSTQIIAGAGLTGGGDLSANRTLDVNVDGTTLGISGDAVGVVDSGITNQKIADNAINNNKIAAAAGIAFSKLASLSGTQKLLGRYSTGVGAPEEIALAGDLDMNSNTLRVAAWTGTKLTKTAGSTAPTIAAGAVTDTEVAASNKDGAAIVPSMRTLGTGALQAASGTDSRLSDSRTPSGAAGGSLAGTYPSPSIAAGAITATEVAAANKDGVAGTPSLRTLGTGAQQAASGADSRLSDSRIPTGSAGGSLAGTYPSPSIAAGAITATEVAAANKDGVAGTPSLRTLGTGAQQAVSGTDSRLSDSRTPTGAAGGSFLNGTYPNPGIANDAITNTQLANMAAATLKGSIAGGDPADLTPDQILQILNSGMTGRSLQSNVSVSATTSEIGILTVPLAANGFVAGATYRAFVVGYGTQTAVAITLTTKLRIGNSGAGASGVVAAQAQATSPGAARTLVPFFSELFFTVRSIGSGTSASAIGGGWIGGQYFALETLNATSGSPTPVTFDSTVAKDLFLSITPSATTFTGGVITNAGIHRV